MPGVFKLIQELDSCLILRFGPLVVGDGHQVDGIYLVNTQPVLSLRAAFGQ